MFTTEVPVQYSTRVYPVLSSGNLAILNPCLYILPVPGYITVCSGKTKTLGPKRGNANLENYCAPLNENLMGTA